MSTSTHANISERSTFGFWLYIMSDCLLFATLFATFAVLRNNIASGPAAGDIFSLPFILLETLVLLTSSFTCGLSLIAMYKNRKMQSLTWLGVTAVLGIVFIALELTEFATLISDGHSWQASAFLSAFFTLVGTHGLHVIAGLLWMVLLIAQIHLKGFTPMIVRRFICLALFWHFLDIIWIFIFSFVYLIPMIM